MTTIRAWFFTQIATWALMLKKTDIALDFYQKILAKQPEHAVTMSRVAFLYSEAGDKPRAIREFERVVAVNKTDANSWFNLGFLRQETGFHTAAIDAFDQAININARHDRAWYGKGLSLIALSRLDDAIAPLKKNAELQPMSPYGHMELARVHFKLGDMDRCETHAQIARVRSEKRRAA
jgi:tetratricopeptide (TPR) repeat protein